MDGRGRKTPDDGSRAARLKAALRANLRRRKTQARPEREADRRDPEEPGDTEEGIPESRTRGAGQDEGS
jgi:hypothetical protein